MCWKMLWKLLTKKKGNKMPADLSELVADVTKARGVVQSATVYVNGVAAKVQAAVDAALANGATEAELQPMRDLANQLEADADALAAALAANP